ncbi:hypothetical protein GCM10020216_036560 [Nonomuraea helvata]
MRAAGHTGKRTYQEVKAQTGGSSASDRHASCVARVARPRRSLAHSGSPVSGGPLIRAVMAEA